MNVCIQFEESIISAAAGDLDAGVQQSLDAHLHGCAACCARLSREQRLFAQLDAGLAHMVAGEPSLEFSSRVMAHVTGEAERQLLVAIDAGMAQTVAADPSPHFAAAVRRRIAAHPAPRAWFGLGWWGPAIGAVAVAILLAFFWPSSLVPAGDRSVTRTAARAVEPAVVQPPVSVRPAAKSASSRKRIPAPHVEQVAAETPEVIVSDEERRAVTRFYRFVQEGRIDPAQVLASNRVALALLLKELATPELGLRAEGINTLDLFPNPRTTSDHK